MKIQREGFFIELSEPTLYVDNQSRGRSGHMTHAIVEYAPNKLMDFNSNCSAVIYNGHSTYGFIEYKLSNDGGKTFSGIYELPYSKQSLFDGVNVISVEKAVATENGEIVAICLRNNAHALCQPWDTPTIVISCDEGKTWSDPKEMCHFKGRVYDACYHEGVIYVLEFCNDGTGDFCGWNDEHLYRIFISKDSGKNFNELCIVPLPTKNRGYGAMLFDSEGKLHVYAYNKADEQFIDHIVSEDKGVTWKKPTQCKVNLGLRNPQIALVNGVFVAHGRCLDWRRLVLYTSKDGEIWDEGAVVREQPNKCACYYSNNIVLKDDNEQEKLLIQFSESYSGECVNVMHMWLRLINE